MKSYTKDEPSSLLSARKLLSYELTITSNIDNFPKKFRHNLVDRIINITLDIMGNVRYAYNNFDKSEKLNGINKAISECDLLKDILPCVLDALHPKCSINHWNLLIDDLLKQLENWKGSLMKK